MAEEKKKPDAAPAGGGHADKAGAEKKESTKAAGGGLLAKTPVLIGGVMIIEAVVLFAGMKFLGGSPKPVSAAELTTEESTADAEASATESKGAASEGHESGAAGAADVKKTDKKKIYEIDVVKDFKAPNRITGRNIIYDVAIVASVKGAYKSKVEAIFGEREGLIKDRVRTIIAQCEPDKLAEPGLETLRRQVKYQLDLLVGPDMIEEVLVPRCIPFRSDF
jgi:hypothetical protein